MWRGGAVTRATNRYYINFGWALQQLPRGTASARQWNVFLAADVVALLLWVTHAVAFASNWAAYDALAARLLEDIADNRLSSAHHTSSSFALHARAFPSTTAAATAFDTVWLIVASARLAQVLLLERLSYTVLAKAFCRLHSCRQFQAGIALYAVALVGVVCLVCLVLFGEAVVHFGDLASTISTVVGFAM